MTTSDIEKLLIEIKNKIDSGGGSSSFDFYQLENIISNLVTDKLLLINDAFNSNNASLQKIRESIDLVIQKKLNHDYYIEKVTNVNYSSHYTNVYSIRWELISGTVQIPYYSPGQSGFLTITGSIENPVILQEYPLLPNMNKYDNAYYSVMFNSLSGTVLIRAIYSY